MPRAALREPHSPDRSRQISHSPSISSCAPTTARLHFDGDALTPRQREDDAANVVLTAMLQVALTYMGKRKDHAAYHELFKAEPWQETLLAYNATFEALFGDVIPPQNYHYIPTEKFYEAVAVTPMPAELLGLYMISGSNFPLHGSRDAWRMSQRVNSKMHFAANAPGADIPVPNTLVTTRADLESAEVEAFFDACDHRVMVKIQGLAGARNVTAVSSIEEAQAYVAEFEPTLEVALQQQLDTAEWTEMTCDLKVSDDDVQITNVRQILFADGLWVGNYISDKLTLSERQRDVCLRVGAYARDQGYSSPQGFNCGIDFFVRGDDIVVIEINARWTGGLFPAHLIHRLGAESEDSIAFIDLISVDARQAYLDFLQQHLHADLKQSGAFRIVTHGVQPVRAIDRRRRADLRVAGRTGGFRGLQGGQERNPRRRGTSDG